MSIIQSIGFLLFENFSHLSVFNLYIFLINKECAEAHSCACGVAKRQWRLFSNDRNGV